MTIKHIQARFTSGNDIPIDKAVVPASEWNAAMAEIQVLKDQFIWDKMAFEKLEKLCDERGTNEARMFMRCRELADQVGQLQEQNRWLDEKLAEMELVSKEKHRAALRFFEREAALEAELAEAEKNAITKSAQVCQDWIDDHSKADACTYNDCDMVAAVTDVRTAILQLQHPNKGPA